LLSAVKLKLLALGKPRFVIKKWKPKASDRISPETTDKLAKQVYDGFIGQLLDLWEENLRRAGSAGGNQGAKGTPS